METFQPSDHVSVEVKLLEVNQGLQIFYLRNAVVVDVQPCDFFEVEHCLTDLRNTILEEVEYLQVFACLQAVLWNACLCFLFGSNLVIHLNRYQLLALEVHMRDGGKEEGASLLFQQGFLVFCLRVGRTF